MQAATGQVQVEFTRGVWTDVTADVDWSTGAATKFGRTSKTGAPQPASLSFVLDNTSGKYTPGRQMMVDAGGAAQPNPLWPNLQPRCRVRLQVTTSTGVKTWFTGYVTSWVPGQQNTQQARCSVAAIDRGDQLAKVTLTTPLRQEISMDGPDLLWTLGDAQGSSSAVESSGWNRAPLLVSGAGSALTFGVDGPGVGDGTAAAFASTGPADGRYLMAGSQFDGRLALWWWFGTQTIEIWVQIAAPPPAGTLYTLWCHDLGGDNAGKFVVASVDSAGHVTVTASWSVPTTVTLAGTTNIADGGWHHVALTGQQASFPTADSSLYVDGVLAASTWSNGLFLVPGQGSGRFTLGRAQPGWSNGPPSPLVGKLAYFAAYNGVCLSAARVAAHAAGRNGYAGETSGQRITRFLGYGGVAPADMSIDSGAAVLGTYSQDGKDPVAASQDAVTSEGGGAVLWVNRDGLSKFRDRRFRDNPAPALILDAGGDIDGGDYSPDFSDRGLVNRAQVQRATASGTQNTLYAADPASIATFGATDAPSTTTYTVSDDDALHLAEWIIAAQSLPAFQWPKLTVDVMTAQSSTIVDDITAACDIGMRIRIQSLDLRLAPQSQMDVHVEGFAATLTDSALKVTFDLSPADAPARALWDDAVYGRWQADGQTLTAAITASAVTIQITSPAGAPTFTTAAADYPLSVLIGAEVLTLAAAPAGAGSPQTFTVLRGQAGTTPAAQVAAAPIVLAPQSTWAF